MTPSQLKAAVMAAGREPFFFTRSTLKFFGDTMRNYGVRSVTIQAYSPMSEDGATLEVWELYRKAPVKHGLKDSAYFCKTTFGRVFPNSEMRKLT